MQAIHPGIPKDQKPASGGKTVVAEAAVAVLATLMQEATYLIVMGLETIITAIIQITAIMATTATIQTIIVIIILIAVQTRLRLYL